MRNDRVKFLGITLALALAAGGCRTTVSSTDQPRTIVRTGGGPPEELSGGGNSNVSPEEILKGDPSAARLHDIEGVLLLYFAVHKQLPEKLDDLRPLADGDAPLNFTNPASGQSYVYTRSGLFAPGSERRIIVYDPTKTAGDKFWCIVMSPPVPGKALSADVVALPEPIFRAYGSN